LVLTPFSVDSTTSRSTSTPTCRNGIHRVCRST
jgi:hypothetical protein